jgi:hypothetical protein
MGVLLAGATVGALASLSELPFRAEAGEMGLIRLSWRARGELVRECRRLTPDELADVPLHMRREEVCERRILPYRLRVTVDGVPRIDAVVRAGGAHEDRPLFVFAELPVGPGRHHVRLTFEQEIGDRPWLEAEEDPAHERLETPPHLALDEILAVDRREIVLVTYDDENKRLRVARSP